MLADLNGVEEEKRQGEAYLDLGYNLSYSGETRDLEGKEISYWIKIPGVENSEELGAGKIISEENPIIAQVFVKDGGWQGEYGTEVLITRSETWYRVSIVPSKETPAWGWKDEGFDADAIRAIGVRLKCPYRDSEYKGKVYIKDANEEKSAPSGEEYILDPVLVKKSEIAEYVGLKDGVDSGTGNPNYISWESLGDYLNVNSVEENSGINLEKGNWKRRTKDAWTAGVVGIERDEALDWWRVEMDITNYVNGVTRGEMYLDLRYDVEGYKYRGPIDLRGEEIKFSVEAPAGEGSSNIGGKVWAQVFVKDEGYNWKYGKRVLLGEEGTWYEISLDVSEINGLSGESSMESGGDGEISIFGTGAEKEGFDASRVAEIGIKISCDNDPWLVSNNPGSVDYEGPIYVKNLTNEETFKDISPKLEIDMSGLKRYGEEEEIELTFREDIRNEVKLARESLPNYFKDDTWTMSVEYDAYGKVKSALKGNTRVEHYDEEGRLVEITDPEWGSVAVYSYDEEGNLSDINYEGMREGTRKGLEGARREVEFKKNEALLEIAKGKALGEKYVSEEIKGGISKCEEALSELNNSLNEINNWKPFWPGDRKKKNSIRQDIERQIEEVRDKKNELEGLVVTAYEKIDADIETANREVMEEYSDSIKLVEERTANAEREILEEEARQVLYVYYSKILGRSPNEEEVKGWIEKGD
ncbi:hypothetical protein OMAG_001439 [Candidatus Omnitrophus magneticus]|uniref:YD repeat-containing protein n=1 Tax=Candidatus Omnitrophus magneticus TaxID=1609969 RepID=A0A0F0CMZ2_9BACT|nr:hypothetical protein OMAG_001439 [Candidatus Omnitrophus magneticus]